MIKKKIIIIFLILIISLLFYFLCYNISSNFENIDKKYMTFNNNDFKNLSVEDRWKIRFKVFENYDNLKHNYNSIYFKKFNRPINNNNKIFINIASYRDPECPKTINILIKNCSNKENLRIVVCEQNELSDVSSLKGNENYSHLIEIIKINASEAKGPTYARFLIQQKYENEEFYMQIDSHTIFENNWDLKLINSLNNLKDKSCITQYLPEYNINSRKMKSYSIRDGLTVSDVTALDGFTRVSSNFINIVNKSKDVNKANAWSGCFSFSRGDICVDAPIDPLTPEVFFGEEMDITLRLYTRGWNFYSPNYSIAFTNFDRSYRNTFWHKKTYNKKLTLLSRFRIHYRLGTLPEYYKNIIKLKYPLLINQQENFLPGNVKTLEDYENFIGFDLVPNF